MEIESDIHEIKAAAPRTPAESLARQVELLEAIRDSLDRQQRVMLHLVEQQNTQAEQLTDLSAHITYLSEALLPDAETHPGRQWVKVQDVNVPFMNLAMFLVKLSLASIPAAMALSVIVFAIMALFGLLGISVFSLF